jgi:hypothetical protein
MKYCTKFKAHKKNKNPHEIFKTHWVVGGEEESAEQGVNEQ